MVRRFGILGVSAFLTLSLATGCVVNGDYAQQTPPLYPPGPPRLADKVSTGPQPIYPPSPDRSLNQDPPKPPQPPPPPEMAVDKPLPPEPLAVFHGSSDLNEAPVLASFRCFIEKKDPVEAAEALQKYDQPTREMFLKMLPIMAHMADGGLDSASPQELAALRGQLDQVMALLKTRAPLTVDKACYCRRIGGYGLYDPLPDDHGFAGGERHLGEFVQLYVEARNFTNRQNGRYYETLLASKLEIHDSQGGVVARMDFPAKPDHSLSPRQDYFIHYQFYVPARMEPDDYTLNIYLTDENVAANKGPRKPLHTMRFRVVGPVQARAGQ